MNYAESMGDDNPFSKFWSDWTSQMMGMGFTPPSGDAREAMARQMRQAFFDAWAKCCEEFMGSEVFLDAMKRSMDGSLAFRQQMNEFLTKALHDAQAPARSDTDSILLVLRSMEERVLSRIDQLSDRVAALEESQGGEVKQRPTSGPSAKSGRGASRRAQGGVR